MNGSEMKYQWRFFRAGGFDQVQIESGSDLLNLKNLDQKLWVALACPVEGVEIDRRTLELIDSDGDGFIRPPELLAAIGWVADRVRDMDVLLKTPAALPLSEVCNSRDEGKRILDSAATILGKLEKTDADSVTIEDASDTARIFASTPFNGDGIITRLSSADEKIQQWIDDVAGCCGTVPDRSGEQGIGEGQIELFDQQCQCCLAWAQRGGADQTLAAGVDAEFLQTWKEVKDKIEDYFIRCRLAAYDPRAAISMNASDDSLLALAPKNLTEAGGDIAALPLSAVTSREVLPLLEGVNPAWSERISLFRQEIVQPLVGDVLELSAGEWESIKVRCATAEAWWAERPDSSVLALPVERLGEWQAEGIAESLRELVKADLDVQPVYEGVVDVEKLARLCRDLFPLVNNFVSFRDFYTRRGKATFQAGTLYLDGRSYDLCVQVKDMAKHAVLATFGRIYIIYCECVRSNGEKMTIAAAVTNGDSDHLMSGRNGVFYDRKGNDWNATIVRIIDHPISIRQAFWAPYKRIGRMIGEQIQKMAAARSKAAEEKAATSLMQAGQKKEDAKTQQQQLFDAGKFAGIFAAIGLAIGAIGTALVSVVSGFLKLAWWQMPLAVLGVMLIISGPSVLIAFFKLHQRNLAPILDANGWAVNARTKLNIPFGAALTELPQLPPGAQQSVADPYAEKPSPWKRWVFLLLLLILGYSAWKMGYIPTGPCCRTAPPVPFGPK